MLKKKRCVLMVFVLMAMVTFISNCQAATWTSITENEGSRIYLDIDNISIETNNFVTYWMKIENGNSKYYNTKNAYCLVGFDPNTLKYRMIKYLVEATDGRLLEQEVDGRWDHWVKGTMMDSSIQATLKYSLGKLKWSNVYGAKNKYVSLDTAKETSSKLYYWSKWYDQYATTYFYKCYDKSEQTIELIMVLGVFHSDNSTVLRTNEKFPFNPNSLNGREIELILAR